MRKQLIILILSAPFFICLRCGKCPDGEKRENEDIPLDQKNALFHFSNGTRWVFKSNGGDADTIYLGPLIYSYEDGHCDGSAGCCTKLYPQRIRQDFNTILDADGLDKFDYYYDNRTHWLKGKIGGTFAFSEYQGFFTSYYRSSLTVNGITLTDVESRITPGINKGDIGIDAAYWSLSKGLVRYDYQQTDGSYIIYERQDL